MSQLQPPWLDEVKAQQELSADLSTLPVSCPATAAAHMHALGEVRQAAHASQIKTRHATPLCHHTVSPALGAARSVLRLLPKLP